LRKIDDCLFAIYTLMVNDRYTARSIFKYQNYQHKKPL
jgi:hypothetical protein